MTTSQDAIAAFLAKGGKVIKAAEGEGRGLTNRQWYLASRDSMPVVKQFGIDADDIELANLDEALAIREQEIACTHGIDGLNDFRAGLRKHGAKVMLGWKE